MNFIHHPILPELYKFVENSVHHYVEAQKRNCSITDESLKHLYFANKIDSVDIQTEVIESNGERKETVSYHYSPTHQRFDFTLHFTKEEPLLVTIDLQVMESFTEFILPRHIHGSLYHTHSQNELINDIQQRIGNFTASALRELFSETASNLPNQNQVWEVIQSIEQVQYICSSVDLLSRIHQLYTPQATKHLMINRASDAMSRSFKKRIIHLLTGAIAAGVITWSDEQLNIFRTFGILPVRPIPSVIIDGYVDMHTLDETERALLDENSPDVIHVITTSYDVLSSITYVCQVENQMKIISVIGCKDEEVTHVIHAEDSESLFLKGTAVIHERYGIERV